MRPSELLLDLGRPVAYYPGLVKYFGSVNAVLFFCQFMYWTGKEESELGIYKSADEIQEETGLTYKMQIAARKSLISLGVLKEHYERINHRMYYKVDEERLSQIIENKEIITSNSRPAKREDGELPKGKMGKRQKGSSGTAKREFRELPKGKVDPTETTAESTTESTTPPKSPQGARRSGPHIPVIELPDWMPADLWRDFAEMRIERKKPMTLRAMQLMVKTIGRLKDAGNDPAAVLEQSIRNGWTDCYEIKQERSTRSNGRNMNSISPVDTRIPPGFRG